MSSQLELSGEAYPDKTEVYGVGAFLSAGSEIYKLYGGK